MYQHTETSDIIVASEEAANGDHRRLYPAHGYHDKIEYLHAHTPNEHATTAKVVDDGRVEHHKTCHEGYIANCQGNALGYYLPDDSKKALFWHTETQFTLVVEMAAEDDYHNHVAGDCGIHCSADSPMEYTYKQQIEHDVDDTGNNDGTGNYLWVAIGLCEATYCIIYEERHQLEQKEETQVGRGIARNRSVGTNKRHYHVAEQTASHDQYQA